MFAILYNGLEIIGAVFALGMLACFIGAILRIVFDETFSTVRTIRFNREAKKFFRTERKRSSNDDDFFNNIEEFRNDFA